MSLDPKYLSKERLEARAEKELEKFAGGAQLVAPIPLDVDSFAEFHLGAALDYQRLSSDGSVLGMSIFQELSIPVFESTGARVDIVFPERTIVIDDDALRDSPDSRLRFTIAHECAHLLLHRHIYYRDPRMKCKGGTGYRPFTTTSGLRCSCPATRSRRHSPSLPPKAGDHWMSDASAVLSGNSLGLSRFLSRLPQSASRT